MLILERPWTRQPQGAVRLDMSVAGDVVMLAMPTLPFDVTTNKTLTATSAPVTPTNGGLAWRLASGSGSVAVPDSTDLDIPGAFTLFAVVRSTEATGEQFVINKDYDGTSVPMSLCVGGAAAFADGMAMFKAGVGWIKSGIGSVDIRGDNKWHVVVGTYSGYTPGTLLYYVDGVYIAGSTLGQLVVTNTSVYIGRYQTGSSSFRGDIAMAGIARSEWSPGKIAALSANPWQIFSPRRIYIPTAAAATAPSITALSARLITATSAQPRISYS